MTPGIENADPVTFSDDHGLAAVHNLADFDDDDIYRGEPPTAPSPPSPRPRTTSVSSSSSGSSSSFTGPGGRLGTLAAVVEHAITRWARANWSTSSIDSTSTSSSSSSSSHSARTLSTKPARPRRGRRNSGHATLVNAQSERNVVESMRVREELRQAPRSFALYLPPSLTNVIPLPDGSINDHMIRTDSLPDIISRLDSALKRSGRLRRVQERERARQTLDASPTSNPPSTSRDRTPQSRQPNMLPDAGRIRRMRKGKDKEGLSPVSQYVQSMAQHHSTQLYLTPDISSPDVASRKAWFLDITSPNSQDMRSLGKLLHIHPLTLEDILQQDPREKLEFFPKLGYYFIVFRAIEGQKTRDRFRQVRHREGDHTPLEDHSVLGQISVYLVVFREGICVFHFSDITEHTDRVRNKLILLDQTHGSSADWVAHGILDSIVDDIFPFTDELESEVAAIEQIVTLGVDETLSSPSSDPRAASSSTSSYSTQHNWDQEEKFTRDSTDGAFISDIEKQKPSARAHFALPSPTIRQIIRRFCSALRMKLSMPVYGNLRRPLDESSTTLTLRRMARTRRLVTNLTRLLATKTEVIAGIQKRLLSVDARGPGSEEIAIYYGDVQDHILTLQQSLIHYERMLSQSYPTYLTQLRLSASNLNSRLDRVLVFLTTVTVGVFCIQPLVALFSINVKIPANGLTPGHPTIVFPIIIVGALLEISFYLVVVRWWWKKAKRRRGRRQALR